IPLWWAMQEGRMGQGSLNAGTLFFLGFLIIALVYLFSFFYSKDGFGWRSMRVVWQLPLFLSVSMGLSLHNGIAVAEGRVGKKSAFIRTPKFNLAGNKQQWKDNSYLIFKMPFVTYFEGLMALLFSGIASASLLLGFYLMLPFHLMLAVGYGTVFCSSYQSYRLLSMHHHLHRTKNWSLCITPDPDYLIGLWILLIKLFLLQLIPVVCAN